jgi:hypothetical protein
MQKPLLPTLLLLATLFSFGCAKSDDDQAAKQNTYWYVSQYQDAYVDNNSNDDTGMFAGYTFEFNDNNEWLIHSATGITTPAKWGTDATTATLFFKLTNPLAPLNEIVGDWEIVEQTDTDIKLKGIEDISTVNNESIELLHFKRL